VDRFSEYVRSAAFRIDLSQNMIEALVSLKTGEKCYPSSVTWRALHTRGLIDYYGYSGYSHSKISTLTAPGYRIIDLLEWVGVVKFIEPVIEEKELKKYIITYGMKEDTVSEVIEAHSKDEADAILSDKWLEKAWEDMVDECVEWTEELAESMNCHTL